MKNKKKKKDYYLKLRLKRNFFTSLFIIAFGILYVFFSTNGLQEKKEFLKKSVKTEATIVDIEYEFVNDEKNIDEVYVEYIVNNKLYTGTLNEISSNMYIGKKVDIYYNPSNPQEFVQNDEFTNNLFKYMGYFILMVGVIAIISAIKELILYRSTLNAEEIEANIEEIVEKEEKLYAILNKGVDFLNSLNLNINGVKKVVYKTFIIKCVWEDEKGDKYTFYSKKYNQPYFKTEFEKLDLKTLNVRFKDKKRYIVITEKIDKKLMA